ncbi:uncharacterized protein FA14DRAFT_80806 [Meira miltonrushii]|uniref:PHD-type domain-containing protein n=1 Tax=Meira miltonrushii TaxID=1280837 RepID=A0A316V636_9BASI|nr:uncharacterized protein FA14DRAFT_80806 [Meira miltonrushii]PWN33047.1 hypothetical protein FA14DRAFT_80806 [Meira miltonrushii]
MSGPLRTEEEGGGEREMHDINTSSHGTANSSTTEANQWEGNDINAQRQDDLSPGNTQPPAAKKTKMTHESDSASSAVLAVEEDHRSPSSSVPPPSSSTSRAATPTVTPSTKKKTKRQSAPNTVKKVRKTNTANKRAKTERQDSIVATPEPDLTVAPTAEEESDTKLYCICRSLYDEERMMIACDRCDDWYHTICMKMKDEQAELVDVFICPNCERSTEKRTTWKPKCIRNECTHAALRPLSRYCSERCGIIVASQKIKAVNGTGSANVNGNEVSKAASRSTAYEKSLAEKMLKLPRIASAKRREGIVIWTTEQNDARSNWLRSLLGESVAESIASLVKTESNGTASTLTSVDLEEQRSIILPQIEEIVRLNAQLQRIQAKRDAVNGGLDVLASRTKFFHLAEDRASTLEPIRGEEIESSTAKTNKKGGKAKKSTKSSATNAESNGTAANRGQPRCGYDERLHWEDERFQNWSASTAGKEILSEEKPLDGRIDEGEEVEGADIVPSICGYSKRKCKRHADWSIVRGAEFDIDREKQMQTLSNLSQEVQEIEDRLKVLKITLKQSLLDEDDRRKQVDERLARSLAKEGSRRAAIVQ